VEAHRAREASLDRHRSVARRARAAPSRT
jgi:hypothetical protein